MVSRLEGDASALIRCGFTRTGFIQIVKREHVDALKANTAMLQRIGVSALLVTADDVKRLAPGFVTDDFDLAAYEPKSGYADPVSTATSFMNTAKARGAVFVQDCQVNGINIQSGKVAGVSTTKGGFAAPIVVNAAGAWSRQICQMAGLDLPLGTWSHDVMFVARPPELRLPHPTVIDFPNSMYFRPEGGTDARGNSRTAIRWTKTPTAIQTTLAVASWTGPLTASASASRSWSAADSTPRTAATTASRPTSIPRSVRSVRRLLARHADFSGTGFKTSPAVGLCMSEWILDGAPKTVDISIFTPTRFAKGVRSRQRASVRKHLALTSCRCPPEGHHDDVNEALVE